MLWTALQEWCNSKTDLHLRKHRVFSPCFPNYLHTFHYTPGDTFLFISINVHQYVEKYISYKKRIIFFFNISWVTSMKGRHRMCYSRVSWQTVVFTCKINHQYFRRGNKLEKKKRAPGTERPWISLLGEVNEDPGLHHQNNYRSCHYMEANIFLFFNFFTAECIQTQVSMAATCQASTLQLNILFLHWCWGGETLRPVLIAASSLSLSPKQTSR